MRVGPFVHVAGTTATGADGALVGIGDPGAQTTQILRNIETALAAVGASLRDVLRTRIYVTDISRWEEVGRAHGAVFGEVLPVTTMVQVAALIGPDILVEIEAEAIIAGAETV